MTGRGRRAFRLDDGSRTQVRQSVDDELAHHLDLVAEELVAEGWDEAEARAEAARRFGDLPDTRAYCEDMQHRKGRRERRRDMLSIDDLKQDLKYAVRALRNAPGYASLVVVTLAFGIAANTTIFSVMNPYLLRALPYGEPGALVQVNQVNPTTGWDMDRFSWPAYADWKERSRSFEDLAAYVYGSANVTGTEGPPEQIQYAALSANLFDVLDVTPALGRTFRPEDGTPAGEPVVVLAHGLWERRFGGDPDIVGRTITMDGIVRTVVGVMPPRFNFPFGSAKLWIPVRESATDASRATFPYQLIGRLVEGQTTAGARSELEGIQRELSTLHPETDGRMVGVTVKPLREALNFAWDELNILFRVLLGAVAFVLLIACANVASLTLARGSGRVRELSVRAAMGARRGRIVRQLLTESLVLALTGGLLGVAMAAWLALVLDPLIPEDLYRVGSIGLDRAVLGFSLLVTMVTPLAFGLVPALDAARVDLTTGLKEGSKGTASRARARGRRTLVVAQVALAVVLTTGAGLMLRSFSRVQSIDLGFDAERVATAEIVLPPDAYPSGEERRTFMESAVSAIGSVPGVRSASAVSWLPLNHESIPAQFGSSDMAGRDPDEWPLAISNLVYPGYFETMGIERVSGRDFSLADGTDGDGVVIVNRSLVARVWPGEDPLGRTLLVGDPTDPDEVTVVGVVADVKHADLDPGPAGPQIYRPSLQASSRRFFLLAATDADPADLVSGLREAVSSVAPSLPVPVRPMTDVVAESQLQWSLTSLLLGLFGVGALLLATLGIYGLVSYSASRREREIGVRIAMGATAAEVRSTVIGDGLRLTLTGVAVGIVGAVLLARLATAMLYGVAPFDPLTLVSVGLLFAVVAALASFVPAARASSTDPIRVLRSE